MESSRRFRYKRVTSPLQTRRQPTSSRPTNISFLSLTSLHPSLSSSLEPDRRLLFKLEFLAIIEITFNRLIFSPRSGMAARMPGPEVDSLLALLERAAATAPDGNLTFYRKMSEAPRQFTYSSLLQNAMVGDDYRVGPWVYPLSLSDEAM